MTDYGIDFAQPGLDFLPGLPTESGRLLTVRDIARRLTTDPGTLGRRLPDGYPWDKKNENYGYNVRRLVNAKVRDFGAVQRRIAAECRKDERIRSATAMVTPSAGGRVTIDVRLTDDDGPFRFTIDVSELSVETLFDGRQV